MNEWSGTYIIHSQTSPPITKVEAGMTCTPSLCSPRFPFQGSLPFAQLPAHSLFPGCSVIWWTGRKKQCDFLRGSIICTQALLPDYWVWILTLPFTVRPWARWFPCASLPPPVKRINSAPCPAGSLWRRLGLIRREHWRMGAGPLPRSLYPLQRRVCTHTCIRMHLGFSHCFSHFDSK